MNKDGRKHRHGIYRLYAPIYDRFMAPSFADGHSKMYNSLGLEKEDKVLEVGVGTGISLKHYPSYVKVEAIDYSEPMLSKARKRILDGEVQAEVNLQHISVLLYNFFGERSFHSIIPTIYLKEF